MKPVTWALVFSLSAGLFVQQAAAATIKELFEKAFDSPSGSASGPMEGDMAEMVRRTVPIQGDVIAEIRTIKHFNEKDCRRFSLTMKATFAPASGTRGPVPLPVMEMNYCKGGSFPKEGYDENAGKRVNEQVRDYAREQGITVPAAPTAPPK